MLFKSIVVLLLPVCIIDRNTMAIWERNSALAALLMLATFFVSTAHALEIVNKQIVALTVYVPPICQPCNCPIIYCIRAPCPQQCQCPQIRCNVGEPCQQPDCVCSLVCKLLPGVVVKVGGSVTLSVETFPLAFLTVEIGKQAYVVKAADLKLITITAKVVVTVNACGDKGIQALVYNNPKLAQYKYETICLVRGERYGS